MLIILGHYYNISHLMQEYIEGFIDELYLSSLKQMLKKIRGRQVENQKDQPINEHLQRAEEALVQWKIHMDNYFYPAFCTKQKSEQVKLEMANPQDVQSEKQIINKTTYNTQLKQSNQKLQEINKEQNQDSNKISQTSLSKQRQGIYENEPKDKFDSVITMASASANVSNIFQNSRSSVLFGDLSQFRNSSLFASTLTTKSSAGSLFGTGNSLFQSKQSELTQQTNRLGFPCVKVTKQTRDQSNSLFSGKNSISLFDYFQKQPINKAKIDQNHCESKKVETRNTNILVSPSIQAPQAHILFNNPNFLKNKNEEKRQTNKEHLLNALFNESQNKDSINETNISDDQEQQEKEQQDDNSVYITVQEESQDDQQQVDLQLFHYQHVGSFVIKQLPAQSQKYYLDMISTYYPSNYFHVGPRYAILDFLGQLARKVQETQIPQVLPLDQKVISLGQKIVKYVTLDKITNIRQISSSYYSSNYFHVGPRRTILGYLQTIIGIVSKNQ